MGRLGKAMVPSLVWAIWASGAFTVNALYLLFEGEWVGGGLHAAIAAVGWIVIITEKRKGKVR